VATKSAWADWDSARRALTFISDAPGQAKEPPIMPQLSLPTARLNLHGSHLSTCAWRPSTQSRQAGFTKVTGAEQ
jgi:hypothetical protein